MVAAVCVKDNQRAFMVCIALTLSPWSGPWVKQPELPAFSLSSAGFHLYSHESWRSVNHAVVVQLKINFWEVCLLVWPCTASCVLLLLSCSACMHAACCAFMVLVMSLLTDYAVSSTETKTMEGKFRIYRYNLTWNTSCAASCMLGWCQWSPL